MSKSGGNALKWYLLMGAGGLVGLNVLMLGMRVMWYMEHSFDILNPDIDYLIERY
jgi:hypothetical protein